MATLIQCIGEATQAKEIPEQLALELEAALDKFIAKYIKEGLDPSAAKRMAQADVIDAKMVELALQKRQKALQIIKVKEAIVAAEAHPKGFRRGVVSLITKDIQDMLSETNIDVRANTVLGQFHMKIAKGMEAFRTKRLGLSQDKGGMRDVVREIEGVNTGNKQAADFARRISEVFEDARLRFNRAGGNIRKLENWFPHWWDPKLVAKLSKEDFVQKFGSKLDRDRMISSNGIPMDDLEINVLMGRAYDDITTNGLATLEPTLGGGGTKLANRHQEHRVLVFKEVEDWLNLNESYGRPDLYTTMMDHLSNMSHEISMLEVLGPNPGATFNYLRTMAQKNGASEPGLASLDALWNVASGKVNNTVWVAGADFMKTTRSLLVAAQLGGAFLSSLNDPWIARMTAKMNGIPTMKVFKEALKQFNPASKADRIAAVEMGLVAEAWTTRALAANRFTELTGADFAAKAADFTMRASLLSPWTDALRKGYGMATFSQMAIDSKKAFKNLPKKRQEALARYKITPEEWDIIRSTEAINHKGAKYWSIENLLKREDLDIKTRNKVTSKVHEMVLAEIDHAVLMPDFRSQAIATLGARRGGLGEVTRTVAMYKSFPVLMITKQLYRGASKRALGSKIEYLAELSIGLLVFGAIALQAKELAKGRNPRDMTTVEFWAAAHLQGGGLGIFGDFLYSDQSRFNNSLTKTIMGPGFGLLDDTARLVIGNIQKFVSGKDTNISADMIQFLRRYTPGSSVWFIRGIYERAILDQLLKMGDPQAYKKFKKQMKKRQTEYKQSYWWKPGKALPDSPPDMSKTGVL
tara:strand:+ start:4059 stop:6482 length:2424 start_codon:yes stop_codon:yes gene_type:complete